MERYISIRKRQDEGYYYKKEEGYYYKKGEGYYYKKGSGIMPIRLATQHILSVPVNTCLGWKTMGNPIGLFRPGRNQV